MKEDKGDTPGRPDPLDDYSQVSEESLKRRLILRSALVTALLLAIYALYECSAILLQEPSSPGLVMVAGFVCIGAILLYLLLTRLDTGRWSLVHPIIFWVTGKLRVQRKWLAILAIANIILLSLVAVSIYTGFSSTKLGPQGMGILLMVGFLINSSIIWFFRIQDEEWIEDARY